jgi:hypothetical protein
LAAPPAGSVSYGKKLIAGTSGPSTPSPSATLLPFRKPAMTCSAMSITSSPSLRPFGKPALSPPITPMRLTLPAGVTGIE